MNKHLYETLANRLNIKEDFIYIFNENEVKFILYYNENEIKLLTNGSPFPRIIFNKTYLIRDYYRNIGFIEPNSIKGGRLYMNLYNFREYVSKKVLST